MDNELFSTNNINYKNNNEFQNEIKNKNLINILIIITLFFIIIIISLIFALINLRNLLKKKINQLNILSALNENKTNKNIISFDKNKFVLKTKYDQEIEDYNQLFELFLSNKTEYYIKGRIKSMKKVGKNYDENNITTIQDKLNWLIIHENPENKNQIADKILIHEYSKKILGKDICVPIIKIYNNSDEIDFNELPNKFVLKCNHGSGMNIICKNKSELNYTKAKIRLSSWMRINYGLRNFEYQYININKKIFVETFLADSIQDYKIYCFNGEPKFIRVQKSLPNNSSKINNYYNLDWTLNDIETGLGNHYIRRPDIIFEKPKNLNLMIEYAKKLSHEFTFVRVDLYEVNNTIFLGEMTFAPSNNRFSCKNMNQSLYLGNILNISKINLTLI